MASENIKAGILRHLSEKPGTWSETVAAVSKKMSMGEHFVEEAMKDLVEKNQLKRMADSGIPTYQAPGNVDGKYSDFNDKRLEGMENPTTSGGYDDDPRKRTINSPVAS